MDVKKTKVFSCIVSTFERKNILVIVMERLILLLIYGNDIFMLTVDFYDYQAAMRNQNKVSAWLRYKFNGLFGRHVCSTANAK
jgi:hypothetical protein